MGKKKKGVAIGCTVAVVVVVGLVALGVVALVALVNESDKAMIEPSVYKSVKVGDTEADVRDKLPDGKSFLTEGLDVDGPAQPKGSSCLVLMSTEMPDSLDDEPVFRFCFKDGKLIEKRSYTVKS